METITIIQSADPASEEVHAQELETMEQTEVEASYEIPRLVHWNESSALLLLNLYKEYVQEFASPFTKKKTVWKKIAEIMNTVHGYGVTAVQCENKFKSMSVAYRKAVENNKKSVASHRSQSLFKELDDLYRHNPIVHHIGVASSSGGFQVNNQDGPDQAEQVLSAFVKTGRQKKKRIDIPEWVTKILEGVEKRHQERMERYDKLISVLDKIASK